MREYSFGDFLRDLRRRRGLSQYQLGVLVGVSDKAVSKWENGQAKPKSDMLLRIGEVLGVSVDELLVSEYRSLETENVKGAFAMKNTLWEQTRSTLYERYGDTPPLAVMNRFLTEYEALRHSDAIVHFHLLAMIRRFAEEQQEYVQLIGAYGSSFVGYLAGATDLDPLPPHYECPHCRTVIFAADARCGWDLPPRTCSCGRPMKCDGHDLPFSSFLAPAEQRLHIGMVVSDALYKAIDEIVLSYFKENTVVIMEQSEKAKKLVVMQESRDFSHGQAVSFAEHRELIGKHPMLSVIASDDHDKCRRLMQETNTSFSRVPFTESAVREAFLSGDTDGIPMFQADFLKARIADTKPTTCHELIQLLGLAHGTGVYEDNAERLLQDGVPLREVIAYRDDVFRMIQCAVMRQGLADTGYAHTVMNDVRRGLCSKEGVSDAMRRQLDELGLPAWFADAIGRIGYLFPRAHGVESMKQAMILMWYKLRYPELYRRIMK